MKRNYIKPQMQLIIITPQYLLSGSTDKMYFSTSNGEIDKEEDIW